MCNWVLLTLVKKTDLKPHGRYWGKLGIKRNFLIFCYKPGCPLVLQCWVDVDCLTSGEEGSANVPLPSHIIMAMERGIFVSGEAQAKTVGEAAVDLSGLVSCCCYLEVKVRGNTSFGWWLMHFSCNSTWEKAQIRCLNPGWSVSCDCW